MRASRTRIGTHHVRSNAQTLGKACHLLQRKNDRVCPAILRSTTISKDHNTEPSHLTSSPRLAQSRLLTYRLRPSSMTSRPNSFSNLLGGGLLGSESSNGQPPPCCGWTCGSVSDFAVSLWVIEGPTDGAVDDEPGAEGLPSACPPFR